MLLAKNSSNPSRHRRVGRHAVFGVNADINIALQAIFIYYRFGHCTKYMGPQIILQRIARNAHIRCNDVYEVYRVHSHVPTVRVQLGIARYTFSLLTLIDRVYKVYTRQMSLVCVGHRGSVVGCATYKREIAVSIPGCAESARRLCS